jgi:hypothetical protein
MSAPLVLHLPSARAYAVVMAVLLVLFLGRVVGQILAATTAPSWLPPMGRWYSGLMPYRWLLPTQIAFLVLMTAMTIGVGRRSPPFGTLSADAGAWIVWASYVYALGMVARSIRYALATPERRGVLIPIVFHFVLAGFLFAYGSAAIVRPRHPRASAAPCSSSRASAAPCSSSRASAASRGICTRVVSSESGQVRIPRLRSG